MPQTNKPVSTAGMVVIGNEILSGKVEDSNSPFMCRELTALGVQVLRLATVPDDVDEIGRTTRAFSEAFTWVFTSGGIGPTHDDMTIPAIAKAFETPVVTHPALEASLQHHYGERLTENHLLMAQIPEGAELVEIEGLYYPQILYRNIYIFPGVPELLRYKFNAIKERFRGEPALVRELYMKADEGMIASALREVEEAHEGVMIGSYPSFFRDDYSVKVTVEGRHEESVLRALGELKSRLEALAVTLVREN